MSWCGGGSNKGYCASCGGVVYRTPMRAVRYKNRYCNKNCLKKHMSSNGYRGKITDDVIREALIRCMKGMSLTKSAKIAGIDNKTLRNRFRKLSLRMVSDIDLEKMDMEIFDAINIVARKYGFGFTGWVFNEHDRIFQWAKQEDGRYYRDKQLPSVGISLTLLEQEYIDKFKIHQMGGTREYLCISCGCSAFKNHCEYCGQEWTDEEYVKYIKQHIKKSHQEQFLPANVV